MRSLKNKQLFEDRLAWDRSSVPQYYVRLNIDPVFAQEMHDKGETPMSDLETALSELSYSVQEYSTENYTFASIAVAGSNIDECREFINAVWEDLYPGEQDRLDVLITAVDGTDMTDVMEVLYTNYIGFMDYLKLCTRIAAVLPLYRAKDALGVFFHQSYLATADPGAGFSTFLASFSDFLSKCGIFKGENDNFYEYILGEKTEGGKTSADDILSGLYEDDHENTVIGIDISYFLSGTHDDELRSLLHRLYKLEDKYIFVFRIPYLEDRAYADFHRKLSDVLNIRKLSFPPLTDMLLRESLNRMFRRIDMTPDEEVFSLFFEKVREEKRDGRFYGFKSVQKIFGEICWLKAESDARLISGGQSPDTEHLKPSELDGLIERSYTEKPPIEELREMIGMDDIADRLMEIVSQLKLAKNDPTMERPCLHMRFTGAPGTGKTTVARIVGRLFREEGILSKGNFFEHTARNLCGEYVGQTAPRTAAICRDAYGSVLFIDEAYSLYGGDEDGRDYGREAITTLVAEMENHRDDMVVIMAGYTDDMDTLMEANAGLRSRMPFKIEFNSYDRDQLFEIYMLMVRKHFQYQPEFETAVKDYFAALSDSYIESREFSNARFVRNLYERTWSKASLRTSMAGRKSVILTAEDFKAASSEKEFSEKLMLKKKLGF